MVAQEAFTRAALAQEANMPDIRALPFQGHLKRLDPSNWPPNLDLVFPILFPGFSDTSDFRDWEDAPQHVVDALLAIPKVKLLSPKLPRRFGGYALPSGRYHTVCSDEVGDDGGTLIDELRAYRDPTVSGMVEVADFGLGSFAIVVGDRSYKYDRTQEVAVMFHEPQRVGPILELLEHEMLESVDGPQAAMVRFPYRVAAVELSRVVDLRDPATRAWFADQFSKPTDTWVWRENIPGKEKLYPAITVRSMYDRSDGPAPVPKTFEDMLPTLLNPVRGGGDAAWGSTTLMGIGEWLRNRDVEALIYPSARCDVYVEYENGRLVGFGGWNLVDFRPDPDEQPTDFVVFDTSPWSWVSLPRGVTIRLAEVTSDRTGSFAIEGVVERSRHLYINQVRSLSAAEDQIGPNPGAITESEAFALGTYTLRWLHNMIEQRPQEEVTTALLVSQGLLLRNGLEYQAGKVADIADSLAKDGDLQNAIRPLMEVGAAVQAQVADPADLGQIYGAAIDLELVLLTLDRWSLSGHTQVTVPLKLPDLPKLILPEEVQETAEMLLSIIETPGAKVIDAIVLGVKLGLQLERHYKELSGNQASTEAET